MDAGRLWTRAAEQLRSEASDMAWKTWFHDVRPAITEDGRLRLTFPNATARRRVQERYLDTIVRAVADAAGSAIPVELDTAVTEPETPEADLDRDALRQLPPDTERTPAPPVQPGYQVRLSDRFTFETFVTGPSNRLTHAAAQAVAEHPGQAYNPLFIHGGSGLGKTHLLHAIGNYVIRHFGKRQVRYVKTETFVNHFVEAIRSNTTTAFKRYYRQCDVLLVDDIQFLVGKEHTGEEFFHTFNAVHEAAKQIVITSDRPPRTLATLEDRLTSRFLSGLTTDIQPPELETRLAILRMKAAGQPVPVPDTVLELIADHVRDNIRELEGALTRLTAFANLDGTAVTPELAERVLEDVFHAGAGRQITPSLILTTTSDMFGFSLEELCGHSRRRPLVIARQMSMYVFRTLTECSYPEIARHFGNRDHTTVIHAVDKIGNLMKDQRSIYQQVTELTRRVRGGG